MEGVTTITSQLHGIHVWDFHNFYLYESKYLPCNFESFGKDVPGDM